jgi:hypothetical protein
MPIQQERLDWNSLKDINGISGNLPADDLVLSEIAKVICDAGAQERFGITLLHKHFDVAASEVAVESVFPQEKMSYVSVFNRESLPEGEIFPTVWRFKKARPEVSSDFV